MDEDLTEVKGVRMTRKMKDLLEREAASLERTLAQHIRFILKTHLKEAADE